MEPNEKPRVLHVITALEVGGAERMLERIVTSSQAVDHSVFVLGPLGPIGAELIERGIRVHAIGAASVLDGIHAVKALRRELLQNPPAVVQSWLIHANLIAAVATPRDVPLVWNVRHGLDGFLKEKLSTCFAVLMSGAVSRRARAVIYNSRSAAEQHERLGYSRLRRCIIPNGFNVDASRELRSQGESVRREFGISEDDLIVGLVARVHPIKNHPAFLQAAMAIGREFPKVRFMLIGRGTEPSGMLAQAHKNLADNKIIWVGERQDAERLTAAFDLACNVSLGEAFSNTLGEAMALGVPCLATDVGESAYIIGETGWIATGSSADCIAKTMREALRSGRVALAERGDRAATRIIRHFSLSAVTASYDALYLNLASHPHTYQSDAEKR